MSNGISNWSFSTLMDYERCPFKVKLKKIDRLPEPPRKPDDPLARGSRIHDELMHTVASGTAVPREAKAFDKLLLLARELHQAGMATTEQDWFFDDAWQPTTQANVWLWAKLDLEVDNQAEKTAVVIDYKTGRSAYKTYEHLEQGMLYAACKMMRTPWVETIEAELWYIDEGLIKPYVYTREDALRFLGKFHQRAEKLMSDKILRPNPNRITCKWCPYSPRGTGACPVGV
jgi:CRISPR/Cas system-associated exonuclease Cas4 (RecB family)